MNGFMISAEGQVITVISVCLAVMSLTVRKLVVNQENLKARREEMKELQKELKDAQNSGDSKLMSERYSKLMSLNSEVMKQSFKPMIFTLIPFLLVFSWMRGNYDYTMTGAALVNPLPAGLELRDVNMSGDGIYNQSAGMLVWRIEGIEPGNYSTLNARFAYENGDVDFSEPATLYYKSSTGGMMEPVKSNSTQDMILLKTVDAGDGSATLTFFYNNTKSNIVASIGGFELGWLGWYFISSMLASMMLNKIFNVV